jgi:hypothetical protein
LVLGFGYGDGQLLSVYGLQCGLVVAMWSGQAVVCMWLGGCVGIGINVISGEIGVIIVATFG